MTAQHPIPGPWRGQGATNGPSGSPSPTDTLNGPRGPFHVLDGLTCLCGHDRTFHIIRCYRQDCGCVMFQESADDVDPDVCSGADDCPSSLHIHGCFADSGTCTDPTDHTPGGTHDRRP